jgi:L-rhamnose isomerase/sugar isomerase
MCRRSSGWRSQFGVKAGSINPNLFQDAGVQVRVDLQSQRGDSRQCAGAPAGFGGDRKALGSKDVSLWIADGSNYPGTQSMRKRIEWMEEVLAATHAALGDDQRMLVEYKPFEPAFYHTDIADWGMALELARRAGPKAKVLVDTGITTGDEHRADCDLAAALRCAGRVPLQRPQVCGRRPDAGLDRSVPGVPDLPRDSELWMPKATGGIAYMIDQSHNLKGKVEAMVQTVVTAQELFAKAALVDQEKLAALQQSCDLVEAEETFRGVLDRCAADGEGVAAGAQAAGGAAEGAAESGYVEEAAVRVRQPVQRHAVLGAGDGEPEGCGVAARRRPADSG